MPQRVLWVKSRSTTPVSVTIRFTRIAAVSEKA